MKYNICKLLVCSMALMLGASSFAQSAQDVPYKGEKNPSFAKDGEVWCLVTIKPTMKTVTESVMVKAATCDFEVIPAVFENRSERVQSKAASCRMEVIPAVYEMRSEQICDRKEGKRAIHTPATYKTENFDVIVSPARREWREVDCDLSTDTNTERKEGCYALVTIPARIKNCSREVLCTPASVAYEIIPATFRTIEKRVLVTAESKNRIEIPAEYITVDKRVCVKNESKRRFEVPAVYETREKQVCGTPAHKVWRLSNCVVPVVAAEVLKGDCEKCPTKKTANCNPCKQDWSVVAYDINFRD